MGTIEDHEEYVKAKNDPAFMNSPAVKDPSSIKPGKLGRVPTAVILTRGKQAGSLSGRRGTLITSLWKKLLVRIVLSSECFPQAPPQLVVLSGRVSSILGEEDSLCCQTRFLESVLMLIQ